MSIRRAFITLLLLLVLAIGIILPSASRIGCNKHDLNHPARETCYLMNTIADCIIGLRHYGISLKDKQLKMILSDACAKGLISKEDIKFEKYLTDAWGQPIVLTQQFDNGVETYHILSVGENGQNENGNGDDIVIIITIETNNRYAKRTNCCW